jgi:Phosphopantetheine attachment site
MTSPSAPGGSEKRAMAAVTAVFSTILDRASIGEDDDFFLLGGTSLGVIQAIKLLEHDWSLRVSARQFLLDSRAGAVARACEELGEGAPPSREGGYRAEPLEALKPRAPGE